MRVLLPFAILGLLLVLALAPREEVPGALATPPAPSLGVPSAMPAESKGLDVEAGGSTGVANSLAGSLGALPPYTQHSDPTARPTPRLTLAPQAITTHRPSIVIARPTSVANRIAANGVASRMGSRFPSTYLAIPQGPGFLVRVCGAAHCWTMRSTDAGPDLAMQRSGRVADLSDWVWSYVCGVPLAMGLCPVSTAIVGGKQ